MKARLRVIRISLLFVVSIYLGQSALAQPGHTLSISEGTVFIDGKAIPAEDLPASLDVEGIQANFSYSGNSAPVIELDGNMYTVEDGQLVELGQSEVAGRTVTVFFRNDALGPMPDLEGVFGLKREPSRTYLRQEPVWRDQDEASGTRSQVYSQRANVLAEQARLNKLESAQVAQLLPRLEIQGYLLEMQSQNKDLYERLVRESRLEAEAQGLAADIRTLSEGVERDALIASLQESLDAIFELKQQNRRREIEQLEQQLSDLQDRLEKREAHRQRIIEQRLLELIGEPDPKDW